MTPPGRHEATASGNGDTVQIRFGGDFVRKTLPYLLAGSIGTGAYAMKTQYDSRIDKLEQAQSRIEGKVDIVIDLIKGERRGRR